MPEPKKMEYEEALAESQRTGGTLRYSADKGWYVERGVAGKEVAPWMRVPFAAPWQTTAGAGFQPFWQQSYTTPEGKYTPYQYGMPQLGFGAKQELERAGRQAPTGLGVEQPTLAQEKAMRAEQDAYNVYETMMYSLGQAPLSFDEWIAQGRPEAAPPAGAMKPAVRWDTITDPDTGTLAVVGYDKDNNMVSYEYAGMGRQTTPDVMSEYQREQLNLSQQQAQRDWEQTLWQRQQATTPYQEAERGREWEAEQGALSRQAQEQMQQMMIEWYQQQMQAQQEMQRQQQLAQLRANPTSWLEYASLAGETPRVQPWMMPLAPEQYGFQVGEGIPGYTPEGTSMNLPELTPPSAQYLSRLAPSMRGQFVGYEKGRTGMSPEDVQFKLWSYGPPSGQNRGLQYSR